MTDRYPKAHACFSHELGVGQGSFEDLREDFLLDFGYQTARAYWSDLDDWLCWCHARGLDALDVNGSSVDRYMHSLKKAGYADNTMRRRRMTLRRFAQFAANVSSQASDSRS